MRSLEQITDLGAFDRTSMRVLCYTRHIELFTSNARADIFFPVVGVGAFFRFSKNEMELHFGSLFEWTLSFGEFETFQEIEISGELQ